MTFSPAPLRVENLRVHVASFALHADFSIHPNERVVLQGKSGSGKTTLLRALAGLEPLLGDRGDQGRVWFGDQEVSELPIQERQIGFVFQEQALFSYLSVLDNVTFGLRMRGVPKKEREKEARSWLAKVGLEDKIYSKIAGLSGGEMQRIALIRALIWKPRLILLDEPFSALDPQMREALRKELVELHHLWPVPLLLVTHDEADAAAVATRRLKLEEVPGSLVRRIQPENLDQSRVL